MPRLPNQEKGLSLVEVIIAIMVLAIICTGMMKIFAQGFNISKKEKDFLGACLFAQEIVEEYFNWAAVGAMNGSYSNPPNPVTRNMITYTPALNVIDSPAAPPASSELKQVEVVINWGSGDNFILRTLKANY
ncbi:MAG: prepilin-type N-terminal cleavage/methylation domain-containing protein [Candidatus Omnitrophica bacterium]|nr:prepilin-type N-terminal cleavage/methylation domain-containing protein [Candidatus Omnitrophota bacterium]